MAITPQMIKDLRERTGVGMGKCKEALEEAKGDMELAIANLRKAGMASAVKKQGRDTNEGMIGVAEKNTGVALLELNAETDFVVRNEKFVQLLRDLTDEVLATNPASLEEFMKQKYSKDPSITIDECRSLAVQAIGENIQVRRLAFVSKGKGKSVGVYSHLGGKIVCLVEISGSDAEEALAKDIAMHIAAAAPEYLRPDQVPAHIADQERDVAKGQIPPGKPEEIVKKIINGKLDAFYDATCLERQKYIKDDSITIAQLVAKKGNLKIERFLRWTVGQ